MSVNKQLKDMAGFVSGWGNFLPLFVGIFFVFLLAAGVLAQDFSSPDVSSFLPPECQEAGIRDPVECDAYMQELFAPDSGLSRPSSLTPVEEEAPATCEPACGQCRTCQEGECVLAPFGTPDVVNCGDGQVCDGYGGCVKIIDPTFLSEEQRRAISPADEPPAGACEPACGQCRSCQEGECVLAPFGTPDQNCGVGQVCDGRGGCVQVTNLESLSPELRQLYEADGQTSASAPTAESFSPFGHEAPDFSNFLPPPCQAAGITDSALCIKYMAEQFGGGELFGDRQAISITGEAKRASGSSFDTSQFLPPQCQEAGLTDPQACQRLMFEQAMPPPCREAGVASPEECESLLMREFLPQECRDAGAESPQECEEIVISRHLPSDCKAAGLTNQQECEVLLTKNYLPRICQEQGATTDAECERIMFATYGRPEACAGLLDAECRELIISGAIDAADFLANINAELPPKCAALGADTFQECQELAVRENVPSECKEAGAFTRAACEKVMIEKFQPSPEFLPRPCQEAGTTNIEECRRLMKARFFPAECKEVGIDDEKACEQFLIKKHLPQECRDAGATTREACEKILRETFMTPECRNAGIFDEAACEELMTDKYAKQFRCEGISEAECEIAIAKRHLGQVVKKQKEFQLVKDDLTSLVGKVLAFGDRPSAGVETQGQPPAVHVSEQSELLQNLLPVVPSTGVSLLVVPAEEQSVITEDESLVQTLPAALMNDSDSDGVPDDIEFNLGSDPADTDSDDDGFADSIEIASGFDPVGEGELVQELEAIEKAVISQQTLSQPLLEGEVDQEFTVESAAAADEEETPQVPAPLPPESAIEEIESEPEGLEEEEIFETPPQALSNAAISAVRRFPGQYSNTKYSIVVEDPDGVSEFVVTTATGRAMYGGSPPCLAKLQSGTVTMNPDDFPLTAYVIDCGGNRADGLLADEPALPVGAARPSWLASLATPAHAASARSTVDTNQGIMLRGTATPLTIVTLYIYSDLPIIGTTRTDDRGQWEYTISQALKDGEHKVYVATTNAEGQIVKKSKPFSLLIEGAQAVSPQDFASAVTGQQKSFWQQWWWVLAVVFIIFGAVAIVSQRQKIRNNN